MLLQNGLLEPGGDVRGSPGIEADVIGKTLAGVCSRIDHTRKGDGSADTKEDQTDGSLFHYTPPEKMCGQAGGSSPACHDST
jgi:hypothetical protein